MADLGSTMFDTAISNFWNAQTSTDPATCAAAMDTGLQQFCAAVRIAGSPNPTADSLLQVAINNFWNGQSQSGPQQIATMATGLQQFCAGVKYMYYPPSS